MPDATDTSAQDTRFAVLRGRAERLLEGRFQDDGAPTRSEVEALVHELEVHRIELELQNEELRRAQAELEATRDRYVDLYDFAPVGYLALDEQGRIENVNLTGAAMLGRARSRLLGHPVVGYAHGKTKNGIYAHLRRCRIAPAGDEVADEVVLRTKHRGKVPVQFRTVAFVDPQTGRRRYRSILVDVSQLRAQEHLTGKILEASLNGTYIYDVAKGRPTYVTPAYERLTGYTLAALERMDAAEFFALFHPDDWPQVSRHVEEVVAAADGATLELECRFRRADGTWMWCLARHTAFARNERGQMIQFIGCFVDVTDRKRAEEALREAYREKAEALAQLDALFSAAPIGLGFWDRDLRFVRLNDALAGINGLPIHEQLGKRVDEVVSNLDGIDRLVAAWKEILATGEPKLNVELTGETAAMPGRKRHWIDNWFPIRVGQQIVGVGATVRDVTDLKEAEAKLHDLNEKLERRVRVRTVKLESANRRLEREAERRRAVETALRESESKYRALAETIGDVPFSTDAEGRVTYLGPQVARYGFDPRELIGRHFESIVSPLDRRRAAAEFERFVSSGDESALPIEIRVEAPDGQIYWFASRHTLQRDAGGKPLGTTGILRDVTEPRMLEKALAEVAAQERRRFGQDLHDGLGQELTGLGYLAACLHRELEARRSPAARTAAQLTEGLQQAIASTRAIARGLAPVELSCHGLVPALEHLVANVEACYRLSCRLHCSEAVEVEDPTVAIELFRIAQEAVANAARHAGAQNIDVTLTRKKRVVSLSVRDDGVGVPADASEGPGIGLRIMRYRAGTIGADFQIRTERGQGTTILCTWERE